MVDKEGISIHVPRVRDDPTETEELAILRISIHVPRVRDDQLGWRKCAGAKHFNPRPSCEGRLIANTPDTVMSDISIHVPRVRDDLRF